MVSAKGEAWHSEVVSAGCPHTLKSSTVSTVLHKGKGIGNRAHSMSLNGGTVLCFICQRSSRRRATCNTHTSEVPQTPASETSPPMAVLDYCTQWMCCNTGAVTTCTGAATAVRTSQMPPSPRPRRGRTRRTQKSVIKVWVDSGLGRSGNGINSGAVRTNMPLHSNSSGPSCRTTYNHKLRLGIIRMAKCRCCQSSWRAMATASRPLDRRIAATTASKSLRSMRSAATAARANWRDTAGPGHSTLSRDTANAAVWRPGAMRANSNRYCTVPTVLSLSGWNLAGKTAGGEG